MNRRLILFIGVLLVTLSAEAESVVSHLFQQIEFTDSNLNHLHEQTFKYFDDGNLEESLVWGNELSDQVSKDLEIDSLVYAKVLNNAAILKALAGEHEPAIESLDQAISLTDAINPFHPDLFNMLMARSYIQLDIQLTEAGTESLRRAQHIAHREDGVYAKKQLPIIRRLALISIEQGQYEEADREQRFTLKVSEHAFGANSEEILPTLKSLGNYFANRGYSIPINSNQDTRLHRDLLFRESIQLFERSIAIVEDKYGDNDLRLVEPLKGLSQTRFMQGSSRSFVKASMERAASIVSSNPSTDVPEIARSLVTLGDTYLLTNDPRALDEYQKAWDLLSKRPEYEQLRHDLFGRPKRLSEPVQYVLDRQPTTAEVGVELYVDLEYDIQGDGRVRNVRVLEGNVPNSQKKILRQQISGMKFRPRMVDGEFSVSKGLSLHQTFRVAAAKQPSTVKVSREPEQPTVIQN